MIRPLRKKDQSLVFSIPGDVSQVVLHSPALRLCDAIGAYWDDRRSLGMLVGNISLFDSHGYSALDEHHKLEMRVGWNGYENAQARWTSGETPINFPPRAAYSLGILTLEIHDTCYDAVERILRAESGSNAA
ncbi:hypothetical protein ABHV46_05775 [Asaia sp. BMEF1]|uniref:hypothetical protein n=1 Tax=Asaia sp. BMEF1 TaxID=3155932 RepID=UPI003F661EEB